MMYGEKQCPICSLKIKGRSDKKFCSVKCKSIDQYGRRQEKERFFFEVEKQLKVNRKILKKHNLAGYTTIRKATLLEEGFNPKFFTHYWKNQKGDVYLFVYEYGFLSKLLNGKDKYLLVVWQEYMNRDFQY